MNGEVRPTADIALGIMTSDETADFKHPYRVLPPGNSKWLELKVDKIIKAIDTERYLSTKYLEALRDIEVMLCCPSDQIGDEEMLRDINSRIKKALGLDKSYSTPKEE